MNKNQVDLLSQHKTLKDFKNFMSLNAVGWVLVNHNETMVSYQKNIQAQKGSCLITFILLLLGIIPGLLYLYFSHRSASISQLTVIADEDGYLSPSGDSVGMKLYNKFIGVEPEGGEKLKEWIEKNPVLIIGVVVAFFAIFVFSQLMK